MSSKKNTTSEDVFLRVSTKSQPVEQRLEFWRSLHDRIDIDTPGRASRKDYRASLVRYVDASGVGFDFSSSDDNVADFGKPESDLVIVSVPIAGESRMTTRTDSRIRITPSSGLTVVNGDEIIRSYGKDFSHAYLTFERSQIEAALGLQKGMLARGVFSLGDDGLSRMLQSHLHAMALNNVQFDADAARIATRAAADMALGALASCSENLIEANTDLLGDACFEAANRFIAMNISDVSLTVDEVARAMGVSRAHLYRVFEQKQASIGDCIRNLRIQRASEILQSDPSRPIKQVAFMAGYRSASAFSRAFRDYTGISPSDFRMDLISRRQ